MGVARCPTWGAIKRARAAAGEGKLCGKNDVLARPRPDPFHESPPTAASERLRIEPEQVHVGDASTGEDRAIEGGSAGEKARDHHMPRGIRRDSSAALAARAVECLRPEVGPGGGELAH